MGMPELALDNDQRHALVGHLDRVRMLELMGREPPPDSRCDGRPAQLASRWRRLPVTPGGRAMDNAEQRAGRELDPELLPGLDLLPRPAVHPDLATLVALAMAHQHGAATRVEVGLSERERFADPQPCSPYLQGIDNAEIIDAVHARRPPMIPATAGLSASR
jgi:hypothetical protein